MAWPRAPCAETSSSPRTTSSARLGRIQSPEVLEHEPPLLRREPRQLFPRRIAQPGPPARGAGLEQRARALARGDRAQLLEPRLTARPHHGKESARRAVQPLLVARHPRELLDRLGEPAPRPRSRDLAAAPREGERGGVERIHCLFRQRRGLTGVRIPLLALLARRGHLALGKAERPLELRRDERMLPRRLADLPLHCRRPLLDRRLARARRGTALPAAQRCGHLL